jgi:hypothetical protein
MLSLHAGANVYREILSGLHTYIDCAVMLYSIIARTYGRWFMKKIQQDATVYQNFITPYLYEAQHVMGDTPPIIRSLKPHCSLWFFICGRLLDL